MYLVAVLTIILYLAWGVISRKEQVPKDTQRLLRPFYRMALLLYKKLCIRRQRVFQAIQVRKDLERLYPEKNLTVLMTDYYVKKIALMLAVLLLGTGIGTVLKLQTQGNKILRENSLVFRGDYLGQDRRLALEAGVGEKSKTNLELTVYHRELTQEEADLLQAEFWEKIHAIVRGENTSLEHVTEDLNCILEWEGYPFAVEWRSSRPEIISQTGRVGELSETKDVLLIAIITYGEWEWKHELNVKVFPPERTEEERLYHELEQMITKAEASSRQQNSWKLPDKIEGKQIVWREREEDNSLMLWGIMAIVTFGIYFFADQDLHGKIKEKNKLMREEYPFIVNKMALYLGAGMTVRGAFSRIAGHYLMQLKEGSRTHPAYEEMVFTCRELQDGVAEGSAYEHFGKRTGLQEYIRFSTLLSQNLKKGNSALLPRLKEESSQMMKEQINYQRQRGEEAGTKLLLPMIVMLGIVMVLIMIPAFSSFGI